MSNIDISVIIPVYNRENLIARCIRSLLNQSISKISFEIICLFSVITIFSPVILQIRTRLALLLLLEMKGAQI